MDGTDGTLLNQVRTSISRWTAIGMAALTMGCGSYHLARERTGAIDEKVERLEQQYDMTIKTDDAFQEQPRLLSDLAAVLDREQAEDSVYTDQLAISDWHVVQLVDQMGGFASDISDRVWVDADALNEETKARNIFSHEFAHIDHDNKSQGFEEEWRAVNRMIGHPGYAERDGGYVQQITAWEEGNISYYGAQSLDEDVAELAAAMETTPSVVVEAVDANPQLYQKLQVLELYDIVPDGATAYIALQMKSTDIWRTEGEAWKGILNEEAAVAYAEQMEEMMETTDFGVFEGYALNHRGFVASRSDMIPDSTALSLYRQALQVEYKDPKAYESSLRRAADMSDSLDLGYHREVFEEALDRYEERRQQGDIDMHETGVNEYLREAGVFDETALLIDEVAGQLRRRP